MCLIQDAHTLFLSSPLFFFFAFFSYSPRARSRGFVYSMHAVRLRHAATIHILPPSAIFRSNYNVRGTIVGSWPFKRKSFRYSARSRFRFEKFARINVCTIERFVSRNSQDRKTTIKYRMDLDDSAMFCLSYTHSLYSLYT